MGFGGGDPFGDLFTSVDYYSAFHRACFWEEMTHERKEMRRERRVTAGKRQLHKRSVCMFCFVFGDGGVMLSLHGVRVVVVLVLSGLELTQLQVRWDVSFPASCAFSPSCR